MTKRALVLSGGGSKGAYQLGVLQYLMGIKELDYDIMCGTSVGAINAAYLSQVALGAPRLAVSRLQQMWDQVSTKKVYKRWFPFGVLHSLWKPSVYNSAPVKKWIHDGLDVDAVQRSGRELRIVAVGLGTGAVMVADQNNKFLADWVIASSAFPVMLTPQKVLTDELWSDGGLRSVTPLGEAIRAGAEEIDMILCTDPFAPTSFDTKGAHAIPQILLRAIDIMNDQVSRADLQIAGLKNDLVTLNPEYRNVKIRIFEPVQTLPYDSLDFSPVNIKKMTAKGLADAMILCEGGITKSSV